MEATIRGSDRDHIRKTRDMTHDSSSTKFAIIPEWVLYHDGLSFAARAVYGALAAHADRDGRCWPSQATLAAKLHTSEATVKRAIAELRKAGAVTATPRHTRGRVKTSNMYRLHKDGPRRADTPRPTDDESLEAPVTQATGDLHTLETGLIHRSHMTPGHRSPVTRKPDPSEPDPISDTPNGPFHAQAGLSHEPSPSTSDLNDDARRRLRSALMAVGDALAQGHAFHDAAPQAAWGDFLDALEDGSQHLGYVDTLLDLAETKWTVTTAIQDAYVAGTELTKLLNTARRRDQLSIA